MCLSHAQFDGEPATGLTMAQRAATDLFSDWAASGRDEGMEKGHTASVESMLEAVLPKLNPGFTAIDVGCGNGWVVRRLNALDACQHASGVDGAVTMIDNAKAIDPDGDYTLAMLPEWRPEAAVDLVHTMEVLYYLQDPMSFLHTLRDAWLKDDGWAVIGVDHYAENEASHDWSSSLNVHMAMHSMNAWIEGMNNAGFRNVKAFQTGAKDGWAGTLVLMGQK